MQPQVDLTTGFITLVPVPEIERGPMGPSGGQGPQGPQGDPGTGGGSFAIGDPVSGATPNRFLFTDNSGNLSDDNFSASTMAFAGGFFTVPTMAGTDTLGGGGIVDAIQFVGFDATSIGGEPVMGFGMKSGVAAFFSIINVDNFDQYFSVTKDSSDSVQILAFSGNTNGLIDLNTSGFKLGTSGARISTISDDATSASKSHTKGITEYGAKTYGDTLFASALAYENWGVTTNSSSAISSAASRVRVSQRALTNGGSLVKGHARLSVSTGTRKLKHVVYTDNAGVPDVLVAISDELTISNTTEADITFSYSGSQQKVLAPGTYWIGCMDETTGNNLVYSLDSTANGHYQRTNTYASGAPNPFGAGASATGILDVYISVIPGGQESMTFGSIPLGILYLDGSGNVVNDASFTRNSDNIAIGGNTFYDSTAADPDLVSITGKLNQVHLSTYTGGSTQAMGSVGGYISNSAPSAHVGMQGALLTTGGVVDSSGMTALQGALNIQSSSGTITNATVVSTDSGLFGGGDVTNFTVFAVNPPYVDPGYTGTVANLIGLKIGDFGTSTALQTGTGPVKFGDVIFPVKKVTVSAPTYVEGALYYDTTLHKLRVGGAAGWETVTSV